MRRPLVAGNWKMNGSRASVRDLLDGVLAGSDSVSGADIAVCPAFVHLAMVADALDGSSVAWGGQTLCSQPGQGAFTGEVSADMLLDMGCRYVIVGHSERRSLYGEHNSLVAEKFVLARHAGLMPILCVGEQLKDREAGTTETIVGDQLAAIFAHEGGVAALSGSVLAYEPVWAIGTGLTATPEQAQDVHAFIRAQLADQDADMASNMRILYGGSVKSLNAANIFAKQDIDGGLIGGASLQAEEFIKICHAAAASQER